MNSNEKDKQAAQALAALEALAQQGHVDPEVAGRLRTLVASMPTTGVGDAKTHFETPKAKAESALPRTRATQDALDDEDDDLPSPPKRSEPPPSVPERKLEGVALLAEGGMGQVFRTRDLVLSRNLAMKVLHARLGEDGNLRRRFLDEAMVTAQLGHPAIPPVHEMGLLPDGRPYFTMELVSGRTLAELLDEDGANFREARRLEVFQRVCEAVSYAHARGVIHCDIKPQNIMVGAFGEVKVMDWGVARLVVPTNTSEVVEAPVVMTASDLRGSTAIAGTPGYMSPEQALGEVSRMGPAADVFALGVLLYELLADTRPYVGSPPQLLYLALQGEVPPLPKKPNSIVDDTLFSLIVKAMRPEPSERYADAGALGADVARWREGALQREKALSIVRQARERFPELGPLRSRAAELRSQAQTMLASLSPTASAEERRTGWSIEDAAVLLEHRAAMVTAELEQLLQASLVHAPGLREARSLLADLAYERHRAAEQRNAVEDAAFAEAQLRSYDVGDYAEYLAGTARLTLATQVPCRARLHRFVLRDRQLVPEATEDLGTTPLLNIELPIGSYVVELIPKGRARVHYPVVLRRREGWDGQKPGTSRPTPIAIPAAGVLLENEVLISEGYGPRNAGGKREWIEAFAMRRHPVTFREFAVFLSDEAGAPFRETVLRDGLGLFRPDWPAIGVSWDAANTYAQWLATRTGVPWRLPTEQEWEKAARGVDDRLFPWGDFGDGSLCHVRTDDRAPAAPSAVERFPTDLSPYGVRGLAGNVREWCENLFHGEANPQRGALRSVRGGSFRLPVDAAKVIARSGLAAHRGFVDVGFRLVRSLT